MEMRIVFSVEWKWEVLVYWQILETVQWSHYTPDEKKVTEIAQILTQLSNMTCSI